MTKQRRENFPGKFLSNKRTHHLFYPFDQPGGTFTFEELNGKSYKTVDDFIRLSA